MAMLAPKIELIKAKYKGRTDQPTMQKQQQEIMELQQKEGYNPMSGCLPLLLQMPIIIFLYKIIRGPLSYICGFSAEEIETIKSVIGSTQIDEIQLVGEIGKYTGDGLAQFADRLTKLPDMYLLGVNLADTPSLKNMSILVLVPVIAAVLTWASMALARKWNANPATQAQNDQMNSSMKMMDLMMPAMTLWMAFSFSGMMGIYWIYQSALGILQSYLIAKAMPLPKFSEEELREMRKAQKDAEKTQRSVAKNAPKYRSLHYIDDEDYDTLPELNTDKKADNKGEMDIPEI
jgi:YidC/Oxa1 family membrane protein insertase